MIFIFGAIGALAGLVLGHFVSGYELSTQVMHDPAGYWFWGGGMVGMALYVIWLILGFIVGFNRPSQH